MLPTQCESLTQYLNEILVERRRRNPYYSMRALARDLRVSPSFLSGVLAGKRMFSSAKIQEVTRYLRLDVRQSNYLASLADFHAVCSEDARSTLASRLAIMRLESTREEVAADETTVLDDWYLPAMLLLAEISPGGLNSRLASRRLGISRKQATRALGKLEKEKWIIRSIDGRWKRTLPSITVHADRNTASFRKYHLRMLAKTHWAFRNIPAEVRVNRSETLALHPEDLPRFRQLVYEFSQRVAGTFHNNRTGSKIYHLGISAIPLDRGSAE